MDVFKEIFSWIGDQLNFVLSWVCFVLPDSPFKLLSYTPIDPYLKYINYFIPLDFMLSTLSAWGAAIGIYYGYQVLLRWIKAIG